MVPWGTRDSWSYNREPDKVEETSWPTRAVRNSRPDRRRDRTRVASDLAARSVRNSQVAPPQNLQQYPPALGQLWWTQSCSAETSQPPEWSSARLIMPQSIPSRQSMNGAYPS